VIYNDTSRSADERLAAYANLFSPADHASLPGFVFRFRPDPIDGRPIVWPLAQELDLHHNLFEAEANREIRSLSLILAHLLPMDLDTPEPGQEDWKRVFVHDGSLRLHFAGDTNLHIEIDETRFYLAPADGRWYIVDWYEFSPLNSDNTWGSLKAQFLTTPLPPPPDGYRVDDWSAWSPDMATIAYHRNVPSSAGPPGVYLTNSDGKNNRLLYEGTWFEPRQLRFSPNGRNLSMTIGFDIYIIDILNGSLRQMTRTGRAEAADWSPDGQQIVYARLFPSPDEPSFLILNVESGNERGLFYNKAPVHGGSPRWSPLGDAIAFAANRTGAPDVLTIHPNGTGFRRLTDSYSEGAWVSDPQWFYGGTHILYTWRLARDPTEETRIIRSDGTDQDVWPTRVYHFDSISPDSRYIITSGAQDDSTWVLFIGDADDPTGGSRRQLTSYSPPPRRPTGIRCR
jgi:hypothetical protein